MSSPLVIALLAVVAIASAGWALRQSIHVRRLRDANADLDRRSRETERASRTKSRFVAGITHELRTPLTAILGFTELLRDGRAGQLNRRQHEFLGVVRTSAGHLLTLIDEALDSASVEAGHIRLDPVPVAPANIAAECVVGLRHLAAERGVEVDFRPQDAGTALLDPSRLRQVLVNFLSNAIKFTDSGGRVTLMLSRRDERLFLAVTDTGIGIADADRQRIFDEFVRLGGNSRAGSGLGLALTRQIVHAQGGGIGVESEPGVGSTFTAWLPWVEADGAPAHSEDAWQEVVAAMGFGDADAPRATPPMVGVRLSPRPARRSRPFRGVAPGPRAADVASRSASAPAARP